MCIILDEKIWDETSEEGGKNVYYLCLGHFGKQVFVEMLSGSFQADVLEHLPLQNNEYLTNKQNDQVLQAYEKTKTKKKHHLHRNILWSFSPHVEGQSWNPISAAHNSHVLQFWDTRPNNIFINRLKKQLAVEVHKKHRDEIWPLSQGAAEGPASHEVRETEAVGILWESIVVDNCWFIIMKGSAQKPLLEKRHSEKNKRLRIHLPSPVSGCHQISSNYLKFERDGFMYCVDLSINFQGLLMVLLYNRCL